MTQKAKNSIELYKNGNPATIEMLLKMQDKNVVNELMEHFHASSIHELAIKLSLG